MDWLKLNNAAQLNEIDAQSATYPVVILKHSTTCSISNTSLNRLERNWKTTDAPTLKAYYLDLLTYRSVSNEIASHYGIQHQSPQILVIANGKCIYHASHMEINYLDILDAVKQAA